ncbi:uncharacterized protein LOC117111448 [Anneissia japonica]|uniref:uncharacterized protein LOC117111448 n=1 Tax=Anneissia japonica TaxID=1529436 RepID=UPI0014258B68|nr:uncharacterized protein LOC117111448 [Anneissia japonica]
MSYIGILCLALVLPGQGTPTFNNVTTGSGILTEGSSVDLCCKVKDLTDDYSTYWYRRTKTGDRTVIYRDGTLINSKLGREAEAYSLHSVYDLQITQLKGRNLGGLLNGNIYTCEIILKGTGEAVLVSSGIILDTYYPPLPMYPICKACNFSSEFIGSSVTISCYSEPGVPTVNLQWTRNGEDVNSLQSATTHSFVYVNYTFILEEDDLGTIFQCKTTQNDWEIGTCNLERDTLSYCYSDPTPTEGPDDKSFSLIITITVITSIILLCVCVCLFCYIYRKRGNEQPTNNGSNNKLENVEPVYEQPCSPTCNPEDVDFNVINIVNGSEVLQDGYHTHIEVNNSRSRSEKRAVANLYDL